ncbi:hypothetical protein SAMN02745157_0584 [Kaistia soli DSM 19436]|uniref:DUF1214 domain-containing protein n=1 Tax=Kaistia soli DSM 19436 TaxID=1122133 RepID=A0A1M4V133_9HYPH|nr:DUF1214 domain-containing protein [Kaistia soli]SHE62684.1 hypothetical protein SAMN02745157_0584 [Kaistia soli DSM 19436]
MRLLINLLVAIAIAVIVGLGSAWLVLDRERIFGAMTRGAWTAWPELGSPNADPYSRAELARSGALPLGDGEGIAFVADSDDSGAALTDRCNYVVSGQTPAARLWTLTVTDRAGNLFETPAHRHGFHAREILRREDGSFAIALSGEPQPGNWLPVTGSGPLRLTLRLYDTPLTSSGIGEATLPAITRKACR